MRDKFSEVLEKGRETVGYLASSCGDKHGKFSILTKWGIINLVSSGETHPWEHVSITVLFNKKPVMPSWDVMCLVKHLFWSEDETVLQFHPKKSEYVNLHPKCLHLWKPPYEVELPPRECV